MAMDWTKNPDLGSVEGMTEQQFAEHVRRQSTRVSRALIAKKYDEADRLALALTGDSVIRGRNLGAAIENPERYSLGELGDWLDRPGLSE